MDNQIDVIKDSIQHLPQGLKNYVLDSSWSKKVDLIGQTNRLTNTEIGALKGEVFLILSGIENYSDFATNIKTNVVDVNPPLLSAVQTDVEKNIFAIVKFDLLDVEKANNSTETEQEHPNKDTILHGIENPAPVKPVIVNPAGVNPILDAQHNLPEGEKWVEIGSGKPVASSNISSSAVPSRGPMLGNFKSNFNSATPMPTVKPYTADPYREPAA